LPTIKSVANNQVVDELCDSHRSPIHLQILHLTTAGLPKLYPRVTSSTSSKTPSPTPNHVHYHTSTSSYQPCNLHNHSLEFSAPQYHTPVPPLPQNPPTPPSFFDAWMNPQLRCLPSPSHSSPQDMAVHATPAFFPLTSPPTGTTVGVG